MLSSWHRVRLLCGDLKLGLTLPRIPTLIGQGVQPPALERGKPGKENLQDMQGVALAGIVGPYAKHQQLVFQELEMQRPHGAKGEEPRSSQGPEWQGLAFSKSQQLPPGRLT